MIRRSMNSILTIMATDLKNVRQQDLDTSVGSHSIFALTVFLLQAFLRIPREENTTLNYY